MSAPLEDTWQSPDDQNRPTEVNRAMEPLNWLLTYSSQLLERWDRYVHRRDGLGPWAIQARREGLAKHLGALPADIQTYAQLEHWLRARWRNPPDGCDGILSILEVADRLTFVVRKWRRALDETRAAVPALAPWVNEPGVSALRSWTAEASGDLRRFGGLIHREAVGDLPASLDIPVFRQLLNKLNAMFYQLKSIPAPVAGADGPRTGRTERATHDVVIIHVVPDSGPAKEPKLSLQLPASESATGVSQPPFESPAPPTQPVPAAAVATPTEQYLAIGRIVKEVKFQSSGRLLIRTEDLRRAIEQGTLRAAPRTGRSGCQYHVSVQSFLLNPEFRPFHEIVRVAANSPRSVKLRERKRGGKGKRKGPGHGGKNDKSA